MERRAVAIHEAGHAVAGHVYLTGRESTRLTIKKRGDQGVGGHHWMIEKEERLFSFQHEMFHDIVWGLGAMAAELSSTGRTRTAWRRRRRVTARAA